VNRSPSHASTTFWSTATLCHPLSNVNKKVVRVTKLLIEFYKRIYLTTPFSIGRHIPFGSDHSDGLGQGIRLSTRLKRVDKLTSIRRFDCLTRSGQMKAKGNPIGSGPLKKSPRKTENPCYNIVMKCPKCFNPLRRVASTEDSVWFTCPLGHRFHSETGSGISDSEGHRYAVSE
jgi:hypothetical protein